jgi:hypothetical protein
MDRAFLCVDGARVSASGLGQTTHLVRNALVEA